MFNVEKQKKVHEKAEKLNLAELNKWFDDVNSKINDSTFKLNPEQAASILAVLTTKGLYSLEFKFAKTFLATKSKLENNEVLGTTDVRILQQLLVQTRFTSPVEAEIIAKGIESISAINSDLHEYEQEIAIIAQYIDRKEQEEKTGLEFSEEDTKNMQKINGVVEDTDKAEKTAKSKSEKSAKTKSSK